MIQVISSVLVHYLDSQTPPVQAELVGQEDRVRPDTLQRERQPSNMTDVESRQYCMPYSTHLTDYKGEWDMETLYI